MFVFPGRDPLPHRVQPSDPVRHLDQEQEDLRSVRAEGGHGNRERIYCHRQGRFPND